MIVHVQSYCNIYKSLIVIIVVITHTVSTFDTMITGPYMFFSLCLLLFFKKHHNEYKVVKKR